MKPKLLALIPTLDDDPRETIRTISRDDLEARIVVCCGSFSLFESLHKEGLDARYESPDPRLDLGTRISRFMNRALDTLEPLSQFDYLLRIDGDTFLPEKYSLPGPGSVYLWSGSTMLCRMSDFVWITARSKECPGPGRFGEVNKEDTYLGARFDQGGFRMLEWERKPVMKRAWGEGRRRSSYFIQDGLAAYRLGYEPLHFLVSILIYSVRQKRVMNLLRLWGYLSGALRGVEKWDCSEFIYKKQRHFYWGRSGRLFGEAVKAFFHSQGQV